MKLYGGRVVGGTTAQNKRVLGGSHHAGGDYDR